MPTIDELRNELWQLRQDAAFAELQAIAKRRAVQQKEAELAARLAVVPIGTLLKQERTQRCSAARGKTQYWLITGYKLRNHDTEVELYGVRTSKNGKVRNGMYTWTISSPGTLPEKPKPCPSTPTP
jgi:hypothetical protein